MAKNLQFINVVDIESTCWERDPPRGQTSEVIEIGISVIAMYGTPKRQIVASESIVVLPTRSEISEFCTKLTSLTPEFVKKNGIPFKDAMQILKDKYGAFERVFASWGDYDRRQIERQCRDERVPYPFGPTHLNVKNLFSLRQGLQREIGVENALASLGNKFEGRPHRGIDDSKNIARLLLGLV
jgi:inhibitor of KinA sporulation pathway (predicted exonuclease)